jgi:glycosyltransferase involved in cell wall biosynthesis
MPYAFQGDKGMAGGERNSALAYPQKDARSFTAKLLATTARTLCFASGGREFKWLRCEFRGNLLARRLKKKAQGFNPEGGFHVIANANAISGLARAYRYEIARLASSAGNSLACAPEAASNFLILGQPKNYRRLLANPPYGFREGYRIGLLVTEFETPPKDWDFTFDILHEIWTPSSFSAKGIRQASGLPVKVVPHAVSVSGVQPMQRSVFGIESSQFLGMAIMDLSSCPDRKNPLAHIRAWKAAFGGDSSAHLLIKVRFSKRTRYARKELIAEIGGTQNITLTEALFSDRNISAFQKMADVYISLHRSEGYGLNIHEMLELGKPVIATGWSGNMDYMPRYPRAIPVPFELVPYSDPTFRFPSEGLLWAEADIEAAANALRQVRKCWEAMKARAVRWKTLVEV